MPDFFLEDSTCKQSFIVYITIFLALALMGAVATHIFAIQPRNIFDRCWHHFALHMGYSFCISSNETMSCTACMVDYSSFRALSCILDHSLDKMHVMASVDFTKSLVTFLTFWHTFWPWLTFASLCKYISDAAPHFHILWDETTAWLVKLILTYFFARKFVPKIIHMMHTFPFHLDFWPCETFNPTVLTLPMS